MIRRIFKVTLRVILWFLGLSVVLVLLYRFVPPPVTPLMVIRVFEQSFDEKREVRLYKDWVAIEEMSPSMPLAVITSEDQKFEEHFGFDLEAIEKMNKEIEKNPSNHSFSGNV